MTDIHAIIAAAKHSDSDTEGTDSDDAAWALLRDHAIAMAEALASIDNATVNVGYECSLTEYQRAARLARAYARDALADIVKEANRG